MTNVELAWRNYVQSNKRIDACRAAKDLAGLAIAETSAKHWFGVWLDADKLAARAEPPVAVRAS